jgi:HK97 family phage major capsid protein
MTPEAIKRAHAARLTVANELRSLDVAAADREFTAEETQNETRMHDEIGRLDAVIAGGLDALAKSNALADAVAGLEDRSGEAPVGESAAVLEMRALEAFVSGESKEMHFAPETRAAIQNSNTGSNIVPVTLYNEIIKTAIERSSAVAALAKVINTASGEQINVPTRAGIPTAALVAEGGTYTKSDGTYGTLALNAYKYGFISQVSQELVNDAAFNVAAEVAEMGGDAIAAALGTAFLTGDGSAKPEGALQKAISGTFASATLITGDEILDVVHSLKQPYRNGSVFVVADSTVKLLRKLKGSDGQYIWQDSLVAGAPSNLAGYPVYTEFGMPAAATGLKSVLFGNLGRGMIVRFSQGVSVVRSDEYGFDSDLVSWKWSVRADSGITDGNAFVTYKQA